MDVNFLSKFSECKSEDTLHLKETHDYWHQIQGQLYLTGTSCCDLVVWTPVDMEVIRIRRDELWETHLTILFQCFFTLSAIKTC